MDITLKLTVGQVQRVLVILGQAPYKDIADVIDSIKLQANEQIYKK